MLFLLVFSMIFGGIVFGWVSLQIIQHYNNTAKDRRFGKELRTRKSLRRRKFRKVRKEFRGKTPYSKFKGTQAQWYQRLERFIESKNKDK